MSVHGTEPKAMEQINPKKNLYLFKEPHEKILMNDT